MKNIGNRIKKIREERGYTLQELGKRVNFHYTNLSKIERGERKPTIELIESLSKFFDVPISYFYGETSTVPEEFEKKDVRWIVFGEEMEEKKLTPDEIKKILEVFDKLKEI